MPITIWSHSLDREDQEQMCKRLFPTRTNSAAQWPWAGSERENMVGGWSGSGWMGAPRWGWVSSEQILENPWLWSLEILIIAIMLFPMLLWPKICSPSATCIFVFPSSLFSKHNGFFYIGEIYSKNIFVTCWFFFFFIYTNSVFNLYKLRIEEKGLCINRR